MNTTVKLPTLKSLLKSSALLLLVMTVLCGPIYMFTVTAVSQLLFPKEANGSIIEIKGVKYGSALLGQQFTEARHLWGRPMLPQKAAVKESTGRPLSYGQPSNLSPASAQFAELTAKRVVEMRKANPQAATLKVPVELVTVSGSGLDPEISPAAAEYQVPRIASATGRTAESVREIIKRYTTGRFLGIFGEPRVNVLKVNLALDGLLQ